MHTAGKISESLERRLLYFDYMLPRNTKPPNTSMSNLNQNAPEWLVGLMSHGWSELKKWAKTATIAQMWDATDHFFINSEERAFLQKEIAIRQQIDIDKKLSELKKPRWIEIFTFGLVAAGLIVAILAWLFPHGH